MVRETTKQCDARNWAKDMAKETKQERQEREEAERQQRLVVAKSTYTDRMMAVFERAMKMNFELEVKDAKFVVSDRDDRRWGTFPVTSSWNELADVALFELDMAVDVKEEEAKERERRANLRATALAKLSTEERELLGL